MANIVNQYGQVKLGVRAPLTSTLWGNVFGVWNADTASTVTTLGTGTFAAWNAEDVITATQLGTNVSSVWNGEALGTSLDTSIHRVYNGDNVNDTSGNAQNGTNVGGVTFTTGKVGNAFTFNGSNYVTLPNNSLNFTTDFEIGFWMNLQGTGLDAQQPISNMQRNAGGSTVFGYGITISSSILDFQINNGSSTVSLTVGIGPYYYGWHYFQIQREWGVGSKIKINGVTVASNTSTVNPVYRTDVAHTPSIGVYKNTTGTNYFMSNGGKIDALTIWNRKLTDNESISLYNSGTGAEYPFSTQTLPTYNDAVGTKHGISSSSTLTNGVPGPSFTTGKIGKAFNFDGVNDYIQLPNNSMNFLGDFSISLWVNFNGSNGTLIGSTGFGNNSSPQEGTSGWSLTYSNGYLTFNIYNDNSYSGLEKNNVIVSNAWNHIVITSKSGSNKIYANGVLVISNTSTMRPNYRKTVSTRLGGSSTYLPNSYFFGKMDAVTAWEKELSASEISALYNSGNAQQYPFSDVTLSGVTSDALGSYNGTNNGATFTTGKTGVNSFSFNGSSNYIALPQAALNFNKGNSGQSIGDFSVSFWLNLNTGSSDYQTIISNWGSNGVGWQILVYGGGFIFFAGDGSNGSTARIQHQLGLPKANAINQWVHVVVTYTNQSQVKSYVNGVLTNTTSTTYQVRTNSRNNGIIGAWPQDGDNSGTKYWYLNGKLDAVTLWTKALTNIEASALYNNGTGYQHPFPSSATGYVSSYNDAIGANHGTTPLSTNTNGVPGPSFTTGKIGQAFNFDGVNDIIRLSNNSLDLTGDFSISMWANWSRNNTSQILMSNLTIGASIRGWFIEHAAGQLRFRGLNSSGGDAFYLIHYYTPPLNTWVHYTFVHKNNSNKMYIDGVLISPSGVVGSTHVAYDTPNYPLIGANQYNATTYQEFFQGKLDAVSVWNKELTAEEVTSLYNSGNGKQYPTT